MRKGAENHCQLFGALLAFPTVGAVAQLGERRVRNAKVEGSIPFRSTSLRPQRSGRRWLAGRSPKGESGIRGLGGTASGFGLARPFDALALFWVVVFCDGLFLLRALAWHGPLMLWASLGPGLS